MSTISTYADSTIDDDGSKVARNQIKYATIKTDLTDPLHTFITANLEQANFSATAAPNQSDDSGDSYGVGSLWVDVTNDISYVCLDATANAAVWDVMADNSGWTTPTFTSGDYTANNSMTWTVESGDVSTYAYKIRGKTMTVAFRILTTTVGGTPSTQLKIAIPASKTATKAMLNPCYISDNGTDAIGYCRVEASGTDIIIQLVDASNFTASTNQTNVIGEITFEIN